MHRTGKGTVQHDTQPGLRRGGKSDVLYTHGAECLGPNAGRSTDINRVARGVNGGVQLCSVNSPSHFSGIITYSSQEVIMGDNGAEGALGFMFWATHDGPYRVFSDILLSRVAHDSRGWVSQLSSWETIPQATRSHHYRVLKVFINTFRPPQ